MKANTRMIRQDIEQLKYDSFLNGIEEAFVRYRTGDAKKDRAMLEFAKELMERFVTLYWDEPDDEIRLTTQKVVLEYFMNQN